MSKHTVFIPETNDFRRLTVRQWLAECRVKDANEGTSQILQLATPVTIIAVLPSGEYIDETVEKSTALFRLLEYIARKSGVISHVFCRSWSLGVVALYELNFAQRTPAHRKGGLNIVRNFLENQRGGRVPLRSAFLDLLAFLEVRPTFFSHLTSTPPHAIRYVSCNERHNVKAGTAKKSRVKKQK